MLTAEIFRFGWRESVLLKDVNVALNSGEIVWLKGENGCGKTTLLQLLGGLIPHFFHGEIWEGDVRFEGRPFSEFPPKWFFPRLAYVPAQHAEFHLMTDSVNDEFHLMASLVPDSRVMAHRKEALFHSCPGLKNYETASFNALSDGERRLLLLALYFCQGARLFLVDELTQSLPDSLQVLFQNLLKCIQKEGGAAVLASHSAFEGADTLWEMTGRSVCACAL